MIKNIKRAGIIFLAIAIICFMVIGCLVSTNVIVVGGANKDSLANFDNKEVVADSEFNEDDYDFILSGTCEAMATEWDKAVKQSKANGGTQVKVLMKGHWTAKETTITIDSILTETTSFGNIDGAFLNGCILVDRGVNILLDLSGYTIDRNINKPTSCGSTIYVNGGTLTIEDNKYQGDVINERYTLYKDTSTDYLKYYLTTMAPGRITGGAGASSGGAICVENNGTLNFNSGKIADNKYAVNGGAIYAMDSTLNINDGLFMENYATNLGGAINVNNCVVSIKNAKIIGNSSGKGGGGIYAINSELNIDYIIVDGNFVRTNQAKAGGIWLKNCVTALVDGEINSNSSDFDAGGILVDASNAESNSKLTIQGGTFSKNFAQNGAGIYIASYASCTINNVNIFENVADSCAAGLFVFQLAECVVNNANIFNNVITKPSDHLASGIGVCVGNGSTLTINGGQIANNYVVSNYIPETATRPYGSGGAGIGMFDNKTVGVPTTLILNGGTITNNKSFSYGAGVFNATKDGIINISKSVKVYSNYKMDNDNKNILTNSDWYLTNNQKINITGTLESSGEPQIGISLADDYGNEPFTSGYSTYNSDSPYMHFFNNKVSSIAALNNGDVVFENIISSNVYDFVYLENGTRKNYSDNNLIHAVNDYAKRQEVNGGKLVLGNIAPNTSVNQFVSNINYEGTIIKLKDCVNNVVYGDGADSKFADKLNNGMELAVGTGWRVEIYTNSGEMIEEMYLSVLGDLTGDGKVNSADVNYIRQLANDKALFDSLSDKAYIQLATLIINKNGLSVNDSNLLWNVVCGLVDITYFI